MSRLAPWMLLFVVIIIGYVSHLVSAYQHFGLYTYLAADYRAWWSVSQLMARGDFALIYQVDVLSEIQQHLDHYARAQRFFEVLPVAYLPCYVAGLYPLAWFSPLSGSLVWTALQTGLLLLYLAYFLRRSPLTDKPWMWVAAALSLPVYFNFFFSQVAGLLVIAVGEFFFHLKAGRPRVAGLWLSLWLVKAQCAFPLILCLLLTGQGDILRGFAVGALPQLLLSWGLVGNQGWRDWYHLVTHFSDHYGNWPHGMINWRMVGLRLGDIHIAYIGSALTFLALLWMWRQRLRLPPEFLALGTLSATLLVTWHVHTHTASLLLPGLWLGLEAGMPKRIYAWWCLFPAALVFFWLTLLPACGLITFEEGQDIFYKVIAWSYFLASLSLFLAVLVKCRHWLAIEWGDSD